MFKWMPDKYASAPLQHITEDGGYTYQQVESYLLEEGVEKRLGSIETDPGKLDALQRIWIAYQKTLGEPIFSV